MFTDGYKRSPITKRNQSHISRHRSYFETLSGQEPYLLIVHRQENLHSYCRPQEHLQCLLCVQTYVCAHRCSASWFGCVFAIHGKYPKIPSENIISTKQFFTKLKVVFILQTHYWNQPIEIPSKELQLTKSHRGRNTW